MRRLRDGRILCRARVTIEYAGRHYVHVDPPRTYSHAILPNGEPDPDPWLHGSLACACSRAEYLPNRLAADPELLDERGEFRCGDHIKVCSVVPLRKQLPALYLPECTDEQCRQRATQQLALINFNH